MSIRLGYVDGIVLPRVLFSNIRPSFAHWNCYNPPRLALPSSGERAALVKKNKGSLCEEES